MADAEAVLCESFRQHLDGLLTRHGDVLDKVNRQEAWELGARAAQAAVAPLIWSRAVGERWDTTVVAEFLGVSRQALHDRVKRGSLLGISGRGVTWFPIWQFDLEERRVRPVVAALLQVFRDMNRPLAPVEIATWAQRPQAELEGFVPADWIADGRSDEPVVTAARHSAARIGISAAALTPDADASRTLRDGGLSAGQLPT